MAQPTTPYFFGRDCPHLKEHVAHSCQLRGDGSWNKWRGPALRGEVAVYAAKARRRSIDQRARRVRVSTTEIPPSLRLRSLPDAFVRQSLHQRTIILRNRSSFKPRFLALGTPWFAGYASTNVDG